MQINYKRIIISITSYNFNWLGRPIIQYPQDIFAGNNLECKPDLIIETGIARVIFDFSSSMLSLLDTFQSKKANRKVIGIDIDIRTHNKKALENTV